MVEYLPWAKKVLYEVLAIHKNNGIPTLDIELTAKCTGACCVYCDSKPDVCTRAQDGELDFPMLKELLLEAKSQGLRWVYTCGLGEPLEDGKFWDMIHLLKANHIGLSMFSNGVFIHDIHVAQELKECGVNIILKMDTFQEKTFDEIVGIKGTAKKIYAARDYLLEAGYGEKDGYTDLAFSIVPTRLSIEGIPEVVEFAKKHGIFASIGELEQAGEVVNKSLHSTLSVSENEAKKLKIIADDYAGGSYMRPICPCILTGLHIDNLGDCVVDKDTGLNCKWFLLQNPQVAKIGNVRNESIVSLFQKVTDYRRECFRQHSDKIQKIEATSYLFGGCGGNPGEIIELAMKNGDCL